ncbi:MULTISPECIES: restriction endonuclease subunit S [Vibrio]|uniref:restriction endonuclease subunit S n=1 Tax=Vibrio TaxID=662 RepID=UPI00111CDF5D|nr:MULTISPECIES: restriction endonuclease subunit S [Vibrio]EJZ3963916.1 restriction endonuclease subunit S [Vibrio parahaemolyticus]ELA8132547.1 restriction endonuclease subunit S [Vibrio parahaemolyticus]MBE4394508.1 restriction endonuclease subunit S [Vibrio parahaemolyticus]MDF2282895.1 restriction endonuclease subunit S [Vibrio parahaemolyticus]MDF2287432.1 restriction endonuclease subunit S [Vibrio parahaemolyticus]
MSWSDKSLDELGTVSRGRSRHRPRDAAHLYGGPYPFVQTADVKRAGLYLSEYSKTYSDEGLAQSKLWPTGTLCITIAANIADTSILAIDACFPDSVIGFIPDPEKSDARFIKYLFDAVLKLQYRQVSQGAAQDNLSQGKLLALKFSVPDDVNEQIRIADFIASYDDLIENNRRRIQLLEESARLLYQEWFVYLRFPGHEQAKIIDGVPEGWEKKTLKQIATLNYGKALKADVRIPGPYPVYGSSGDVGSHEKALVDGPGIVIGRKGNIGSVFWVNTDFFPIDTVYFITQEQSSLFLYHALKNVQFINTDVAVPGLNRDMAYSREILVPDEINYQNFIREVQPIQEQINKLQDYSDKLAKARDLLLPKLMSGELAV